MLDQCGITDRCCQWFVLFCGLLFCDLRHPLGGRVKHNCNLGALDFGANCIWRFLLGRTSELGSNRWDLFGPWCFNLDRGPKKIISIFGCQAWHCSISSGDLLFAMRDKSLSAGVLQVFGRSCRGNYALQFCAFFDRRDSFGGRPGRSPENDFA